MSIRSAVFIILALISSAHAQALNEASIRSTLLGLTLEGEYQSGVPWQETFRPDGTTSYEDSSSKAEGTMKFIGAHQICFRYKANSEMSGGCFEVWQRGRHCFDFYATDKSGATIATYTQKARANGWDARGWKVGEGKGDCVADLVS